MSANSSFQLRRLLLFASLVAGSALASRSIDNSSLTYARPYENSVLTENLLSDLNATLGGSRLETFVQNLSNLSADSSDVKLHAEVRLEDFLSPIYDLPPTAKTFMDFYNSRYGVFSKHSDEFLLNERIAYYISSAYENVLGKKYESIFPLEAGFALLGAESKFDPNARPYDPKTKKFLSSGRGLGQILRHMYVTLVDLNREDLETRFSSRLDIDSRDSLFDPEFNAYLSMYLVKDIIESGNYAKLRKVPTISERVELIAQGYHSGSQNMWDESAGENPKERHAHKSNVLKYLNGFYSYRNGVGNV